MSDEQMPDTPMTELAVGAAQLHEMYTSYINAGFPEHRAFELVAIALTVFLES